MGTLHDFPSGAPLQQRRAATAAGFTADEIYGRGGILEAIARRAGHHVRLSSLIAAHGGIGQAKAEKVAIHLSHYILSGQLLPERATPAPRSR